MDTQTFSQILESRTGQQNSTFMVGDDWSQGRTVYGGVIAALANESMRRVVSDDRPLRGLQLALASPNSFGAIQFENEIIREGKSVTIVLSRVSPGGATTGLVTGIYGASRPSALSAAPSIVLPTYDVEALTDLMAPEGMAPKFFQHFQYRFAYGAFPYTGSTERSFGAFVRLVPGEFSRFDLCHIIAMTDALPTPALSMLEAPFPASTLSWSIDILDHSTDFSAEQWWWFSAVLDAVADGYSTYTLHLVNPAGRVAAISRQITSIFG